MAKASPQKSSFNGGELSPRMGGRTDEAKYHAGCSVLQNFIPTVQGPVIRRGGTYFVNEVDNSAKRTWLVPFFLNVTQSYILEFGDQYVRFYTNRGAVLENTIAITGATQANPCAITATNNFSNGQKVFITGLGGMTQLNGQYYRVQGCSGSGFTLTDTDGNAINSTAFSAYTSGGTVARVYTLTTPYAYADLTDSFGNFLLKVEQSEDVLYIFHQKYPVQQMSYYGPLAWTIAPAAIKNGPFGSINSNQNSLVYVTPTITGVTGAAATTTNSQSISAFAAGAISGAGNLIRLTVSSTSNFVSGMPMIVSGVTGSGSTNINGYWKINVIDSTHVDLVGSVFETGMTGASGGTVAYPTGTIRLTVSSTTGLSTGNSVAVWLVLGTTEANGLWSIVVIDGTHIDLVGSTFVNAFSTSSSSVVQGRDGSAITITANNPIFQSVGADENFMIQSPVTTNLSQWQPGATVTAGQRWQVGLYTYIALSGGTTGNYTPIHTQGARFDGPNSTGVNWLFDDAGIGIIQLTSITNPAVAVGMVAVSPPNTNTSAANQTFLWAHGLFGSVQGYPNCGRVFRDRLTVSIGIQLAASVTNDFLNFAPLINGLQTADAGIVISLPTSTNVQWMTAQNSLLIGTAQNEIAVGEVDTTQPFSPTNNQSRIQTAHGSKYVDALPIEYLNMFITRSGQQLCQQMYNWAINGYMAEDMTVLSEHIPKGPDGKQGITQMCWQQEPDKIIWACTTDGRLVGMTYNREQEVFCWHNHPVGGTDATAPLVAKGFTNAVVESVGSIPSPDASQDDLWVIVRRTINGVERRYIEWLVPYFTDVQANLANAIYMDAAITYAGTSTATVNGIYHLKGQTVDVLISGGVHPQVVVSSTGSISLQYAGTPIQIGLPCPAQVVTMRIDAGSQLGSAQGTMKRLHKLVMRLFNTLTGKFGPQGQTLDSLEFRTPQMPMDAPPNLFSGDLRQDYPGGYETDAFVQMLFDKPLPATLISLRPEMDVMEITK